jgi:hypothetical protein
MTTMATLRMAGGAILALAASGASADAQLDDARARWRSAAFSSYEYGYHKYCECHRDSPPETIVTIRDGKVVGVRHRPSGTATEVPAAEKNFDYYWTVDGLFDLIASAQTRGAQVRAQYDAALGFPREIYIDYDAELIGDELDLRLTTASNLAAAR